MKDGPAAFNVAASERYKNIGEVEGRELDYACLQDPERPRTIKNIKKKEQKYFRRLKYRYLL